MDPRRAASEKAKKRKSEVARRPGRLAGQAEGRDDEVPLSRLLAFSLS